MEPPNAALSKAGVEPSAFKPIAGTGILAGTVPGARALEIWLILRESFPGTGLWPIIRGASDFEFDETPAGRAPLPEGSVRDLLRKRTFRLRRELEEIVPDLSAKDDLETIARKMDASGANSFSGAEKEEQAWPGSPPNPEVVLQSIRELTSGEVFESVALWLVPARAPHEVPAILGFGDWNDAPSPELISAGLREWNHAYGSVPACITSDVLECVVDRAPQTQEQAFSLAAEQWALCDDIVMQGTQSVRALAIQLWRSPVWFFWWD
jgi:hypothetical protein